MDPDQWQQLRPLFDRAIDLDDESRSLFLAEVRARDGALHDELVRLLRGQERLKADVSRNAMDLVAPSMVQAIEEEASIDQRRVGECVGPYRLIRLLGAGGMGAVYLAERSDGKFGHRVALKIVRGGFASPSARERFERERSVLAGLHHSGIAQLFDGGETREGQPFYTMEFVEGVPITEYCDGSVSASARLRVLLQVASALGHAHQNLVVHRDIKPSNVLVDASGNAKLVDFGLAKSLETGPERMLTMAGAGPMTPAYAAPEQFHNAPVTVATDVYQFGVLCYFVLARRLPYRADPNDAFEWARAVSTEEPLLLSQARERAGQSEGEADSKGSGRNLGRDLDAIVRKALAKNPAQRYRSVDAMAADIEAFLDGRPVTARRATPGYFAWRFVQRWRYAVAATGLAFIALAATTLFALHQSKLARAEADHANSVSTFLISLFQVSDPGVNRGERLNANQILEQGAERLGHELAGQPLERGRLFSVIGEVYMALGDFARARAPVEQAVAQMRSGPADPLDFAHALSNLAWIDYRQNDSKTALALLDEAELLIPESGQKALEERALVHSRRAVQLLIFSRLQEARAEFERALSVSEKAGTAQTATAARIHNNFGAVLRSLGDQRGAKTQYESALSIWQREYGEDDYRALGTSVNLATTLIELGDLDRARTILLNSNDRLRRIFGVDHVDVATSEFHLGDIARRKGEYDEALTRFAAAEAAWRATLGDRHSYVPNAMANIGRVLVARGDTAAGLQKLEAALELNREVGGNIDVADTLDATVVPLLRLGRTADARRNVDEALSIRREKLPADHVKVIESLVHSGLVRFAEGDDAAAQIAWNEGMERAARNGMADSADGQMLWISTINPEAELLHF